MATLTAAEVENLAAGGAATLFCAWGDSLTASSGASDAAHRWPALLAAALGKAVSNQGVGGETSTQILARVQAADRSLLDRTAILWAGRNNYTDPEAVKADIAAMVTALGHGRFLVLAVPNGDYAGEYAGHTGHDTIVALNADLAGLYGERYLDIRQVLIDAADPVADAAYIAGDTTPGSLRSDLIHPNDDGNAVVYGAVHTSVFGLGYTDVEPPDDTTAPTITSSASVDVDENDTLAHALTADEAVSWSIVGGADQALFELDGSTLTWAGDGTADYEDPQDADADNAYEVTVRATDGAGNTTDQAITVTVADVDEGGGAPTISLQSGKGFAGSVFESTAAGQWRRDGVDISGETGSTYTAVLADEGAAITCNGSNAIELWVPTDLGASLLMWHDADDAATITQTAGSVSQISDKSGNARHGTQATGSLQMQTGVDTLNGRNVLKATADYFSLPNSLGADGAAARGWFGIFRMTTTGDPFFCLGDNGGSGARWTVRKNNGTDFLRIEVQNSGYTSALNVGNANFRSVGCTLDGSGLLSGHTLYLDGTSEAATGTNAILTDATQNKLGARSTTSLTGDFAEDVFVAAPSSTDVERLLGYLHHRWGLAGNLPGGHAYASDPPYQQAP